MASISKISQMITANTSEYDAAIDKTMKKAEALRKAMQNKNIYENFGANFAKLEETNKAQTQFNELSKIGKAVYDQIQQSIADAATVLSSLVNEQSELVNQELLYNQLLHDSYKTQIKLQSAIVPFKSTAISQVNEMSSAIENYVEKIEDAEVLSVRFSPDGLLGSGGAGKPPNIPAVFGQTPEDAGRDFTETINKIRPDGFIKRFAAMFASAIAMAVSKTPAVIKTVGQAAYKTGAFAVRQFSNAIDKLRDSMTTLRALLIGYVTYVLARWFNRVIDANIATLQFAKTIGSTAGEVTALEYAMAQTGQPVEALRAGLEDLQGLLFELELGLPGTVRQFQRLGLAANDFAGKTTTESFVIIADKISKIKDPMKQAMLATQLWGDKAVQLLPLIAQGANGIAAATEKAKNVGLIVDNEKLEKLKEAAIAFDNIKRAVEGIVLQVATKLAPVFGTLLKLADNWLGKLDMGKMLAGVEGVAIDVVTFFIRMYNAVRIVINQIRIEFIKMVNQLKIAMHDLKIGMLELQGADKRAIFNARNERMEELGRQLKDEHQLIPRLEKEIQGFMNDPMNAVQNVKDWFDKVNKELKQQNNKLLLGDAAAAIAKKLAGAFNFQGKSKDMANNLLFPLEQFESKMRELQFAKKTLLPEEFGRQAVKNLNELEEALGANQLRMASLERLGSAGGVSAINRATLEQANANQTPQARIERLLQQGNMNQKALTDYAKRTAEAVENSSVLEFK